MDMTFVECRSSLATIKGNRGAGGAESGGGIQYLAAAFPNGKRNHRRDV